MLIPGKFLTYPIAMTAHTPPISGAADGYPPLPSGPTPFGYYSAETTHTRTPDPRESKIVIELFERVARGDSLYRILIDSERAGKFRRSGKPLARSSALLILRNDTYAGARYDTPALITRELFDRVQEILDNPARKEAYKVTSRRPRYLLTGIATCGLCGRPMEPKEDTRKGRLYQSYRCHQDGEHTVSRAVQFVDDAVRDALIEYADSPTSSRDPIFEFALVPRPQRLDYWNRLPVKQRRAMVKKTANVEILPVGRGQHRSRDGIRITRKGET